MGAFPRSDAYTVSFQLSMSTVMLKSRRRPCSSGDPREHLPGELVPERAPGNELEKRTDNVDRHLLH